MNEKRKSFFAGRLKELREAAGLTQQQAGERAGIDKLTVAKLEQGLREPSWETVQALAAALGVDCTAFTVEPAPAPPARPGRPRKEPEAETPAPETKPSGEKPKGKRGKK